MKRLAQVKYSAFLAILVSVANLANAEASLNATQKIDGVYNLEGGREMAATLILHPDNRFEYAAIYGGADPRADGKWSVEDSIVHLVADQRAPRYTEVEQDSDPLSKLTDSDGIRPMMAVVIATESSRMRWGGVKVTFKFANGRTREGTTNRGGTVYAGLRQEPEWKDVPITEIGLPSLQDTNEIYWIRVKDRTITRIAVEFDPGVGAQAFREGYLEVEAGKPLRLVGSSLEGELRGTYVWNSPAKTGSNP